MHVKDNIWKLYIIKGIMWFMVAMPIIVLFFQENGLNLQEVMILQGSYSLMIALMEIPSGYIADLFGRKKLWFWEQFFVLLDLHYLVSLLAFGIFTCRNTTRNWK